MSQFIYLYSAYLKLQNGWYRIPCPRVKSCVLANRKEMEERTMNVKGNKGAGRKRQTERKK